jgi:L-alanine-DL-glutamate epimerase-like enolase superfamily enzyme
MLGVGMQSTVERIDTYPIKLPFRDVPGRNLRREVPHWRYFEVIECELSDGTIGFGETMLFYTWGATTESDISRAQGKNAVELLWDDSLGQGLQTALFDAVGKALDVPAHRLFGDQVRDAVPLSHWCIDMPRDELVTEAAYAKNNGYTSIKLKGRPWFDIREQVSALADELPSSFRLDIDFNETLLDAEQALPLLRDLERSPIVSHFEAPIPQGNVEGNRRLQRELDTKLVLHYERFDPRTAVETNCLDGSILTAGVSQMRNEAAVADMARWPVWIQLVGTGITTAMTAQVGAVLAAATWPAITCHEIYDATVLSDGLTVADGKIAVPDRPGLGIEVDRDVLDRFRVEKPEERPNPPRLLKTVWPDGPVLYFAGENNVLMKYAQAPENEMRYFAPDGSAQIVPDDGSNTWQELYDRGKEAVVVYEDRAAAPL